MSSIDTITHSSEHLNDFVCCSIPMYCYMLEVLENQKRLDFN